MAGGENKPTQHVMPSRKNILAEAAAIARLYGKDLENVFGNEVAEQIAQRIEALAR